MNVPLSGYRHGIWRPTHEPTQHDGIIGGVNGTAKGKGVFACVAAVALLVGCENPFANSNQGSAAGQSLGNALGIAAVPNLRDVGGYGTSNGTAVARGLVYRSDTFNPLSAQDIGKLARLNLKNDYDLRTPAEVAAQPDQMPPGVQHYVLNVYGDAASGVPANLNTLLLDPKQASAELGGLIDATGMASYRNFITLPSARQAYHTLFTSLSDRQNLPAVFHCTSGKDRTGWAAAALLSLLGVPKDTVMADYMLSNDYLLPQHQQAIDAFVAAGGDRDILVGLYGVKTNWLDAAFDEMQKQYGSIENYFSEGLGIDAAGQKALRDLLLGP